MPVPGGFAAHHPTVTGGTAREQACALATPVPGTHTLKTGGLTPQLRGTGLAWAGPAGGSNKAPSKHEPSESSQCTEKRPGRGLGLSLGLALAGLAWPGLAAAAPPGRAGLPHLGAPVLRPPAGFPKKERPRTAPLEAPAGPAPAHRPPPRGRTALPPAPLPGRQARMRSRPLGREPRAAKLLPSAAQPQPAAPGRAAPAGPGQRGAGTVQDRGATGGWGHSESWGLFGARGWRAKAVLDGEGSTSAGGCRGVRSPAAQQVALAGSHLPALPHGCPLPFTAPQVEGEGRAQPSHDQAWHDCAELCLTPLRPPPAPRSRQGSPQPHAHLSWQPNSCQGPTTAACVLWGKHPPRPRAEKAAVTRRQWCGECFIGPWHHSGAVTRGRLT